MSEPKKPMIFFGQLGEYKYRGWWIIVREWCYVGPFSSRYAAVCEARRRGLL